MILVIRIARVGDMTVMYASNQMPSIRRSVKNVVLANRDSSHIHPIHVFL